MHYVWIRSPAFWLPVAAPIVMIAALAASVELSAVDAARILPVAALCLLLAVLAGLSLAAREGRLRRVVEDGEAPDEAGSSLSVAQAATYRDLFENATDIVFTTDLSGHFLAGNKAVRRLLGYTVEEAKSLTWEKLVAPYDMWKARQMYRRHAGGEKRISFELDTVTACDEIKTFEIGSRPMYRDGELCGFHGIARDITSRKEMEKQLEAARREAESANESKSTFLANMSHEIRTPINGILGFLSLFAKTGLTPRQKEYLAPIEESAGRLLKIIDDILDLSKIEAGRFSIENEIFQFRDVVNSAVELLRPMAEGKGLAITVELDPRIPDRAVGDGTRIGQIVSNLVNNAIKFTDAGSVSVRSRVKEQASSHVLVEVVVRDTGIGISPEHRAALFEPFHQLDARPDRRYSGTGLGLTISKDLVEVMGGNIRVSSEPGQCTEVVFELPLGFAPDSIGTVGPKAPVVSRGFDGSGLSALIVDDNEINRRYLEAVLDQYGMAVRQTASGGAALEACRWERFDVVFMDIHMADMDGIETTRTLRARLAGYRDVPVVAVSADVMGDTGARFTEQGLDEFIAKPVKEKALARLLCGLFPDRAARRDEEASRQGAGTGAERTLDREQGVALAAGDAGLWRQSVAALERQVREDLPRLRTLARDGRHEALRRIGHRLAGAAGYVGAGELGRCARRLEETAGRGQGDPIDEALGELEQAAQRFLDVDADAMIQCPGSPDRS